MKLLKDIMTTNVLSVKAHWPIEALSQFFFDNLVSGAPVIDNNEKLLGVVSITDLAHINVLQRENTAVATTHDYYLDPKVNQQLSQEDITQFKIETESLLTVKDIMTPMIFDVDESTSISKTADIMLKGHIHRLFVTRNKAVVGIVTTMDMLKLIREQH